LPGEIGLNVTSWPASLPATHSLCDGHATTTFPGTLKMVVGELASAEPAHTPKPANALTAARTTRARLTPAARGLDAA